MLLNNFDVPILLDTHVIIWALLKPEELSSKAHSIISPTRIEIAYLINLIMGNSNAQKQKEDKYI